VLSLSALLLAGVYAVTAAPAWLLAPRNAKPPRLTIGWRRVASVIGFGVVLPLALFVAWRWLVPSRPAGYADAGDAALAYGGCAAAIALLTHLLTRRAVAARAAELGLSLPMTMQPQRRRQVVTIGLALIAMAATAVLISPAAELMHFENRTMGRWRRPG
jgi:hypothetical protein